jgi:hypothetical protein
MDSFVFLSRAMHMLHSPLYSHNSICLVFAVLATNNGAFLKSSFAIANYGQQPAACVGDLL